MAAAAALQAAPIGANEHPLAKSVGSITITSFGPFLDVKVNPSQAVAERVAVFLEGMFEGSGTTVTHEAGLPVTATAVSAFVCKLREQVQSASKAPDADEVNYLLHFGVHNGSPVIKVELTAVNCAAFHNPDAEGFVCRASPIAATACTPGSRQFFPADVCAAWEQSVQPGRPIQQMRTTTMSLDEETIAQTVAATNTEYAYVRASRGEGSAQAPLAVSNDAGRYLCNFIYFGSLAVATEVNQTLANNGKMRRYVSIFIHVVSADLMPAKDQATLCSLFLVKYMGLTCKAL